MTGNQIDMILKLKECVFLPGSFDKRFVRSLFKRAALSPDTPLTQNQSRYLAELFHKYRKQIDTTNHNVYCELCNKQVEQL